MQQVGLGVYNLSTICVKTRGKYLPEETIRQILLPLINARFRIENDVRDLAMYSDEDGFRWRDEVLDGGLVAGTAPVSMLSMFHAK